MIDASGKYVLPGCVDPHTHLDMPFGGTVTVDDFESGQTAAAFGGTTMPRRLLHPAARARASPRRSRHGTAKANGKADHRQRLPHGRHRPRRGRDARGARDAARDQGVTSYKLFMAYKGALMVDDETLFRDDGGRVEIGRARDGARRERRRRSTCS